MMAGPADSRKPCEPKQQASPADPSPPSRDKTCAIVVTFNPDTGFPERLRRIEAQFPMVFLVDNASSDEAALVAAKERPACVRVVRNSENLGVAKALNQGLATARDAGFEWAVTFDQDTLVSAAILDCLLAAAHEAASGNLLIGANYLDKHRGRIAHRGASGDGATFPRKTLITSGMLLPLHFAIQIGGFREDYFIDSVDHEFCLRAAARGARVLMTRESMMEHSIGRQGEGMRWKRAMSSNHPPLRKYYIARNALLTMRLHGTKHPAWALRQMARLLAEAVAITCFEPDRRAKLPAFARGLVDGMMQRSKRAPG